MIGIALISFVPGFQCLIWPGLHCRSIHFVQSNSHWGWHKPQPAALSQCMLFAFWLGHCARLAQQAPTLTLSLCNRRPILYPDRHPTLSFFKRSHAFVCFGTNIISVGLPLEIGSQNYTQQLCFVVSSTVFLNPGILSSTGKSCVLLKINFITCVFFSLILRAFLR